MIDAVHKGTIPPSGKQGRVPNRKFVISANDVPNNEQAIPLKVFFGTQKLTGNYIYPVFNYKAQKVKQDVPKGDDIIVGYNYFGSLAMALCVGPVGQLHEIRNSNTVIWDDGPLDPSSADENGMTLIVTKLGPINFYWGLPDQQPDSLLQALTVDFGSGPSPAIVAGLPRVCYFVGSRMKWGRQPTPPALEFVMSKFPEALDLSAHELTGDAVLPECLYEWLTDKFYGLGVSASGIDTDSFVAACEQLIDEDIGVSPFVDEFSDSRDVLAKFNLYVGGYPYLKNGKIFFRLVRDGDETPTPIGVEAMAEEPEPDNEGWDSTWNFTSVSFKDRLHNWGDGGGLYEDAANGIITGENRSKNYDLPWVTRQAVADKIAARIGIKAGKPACQWSLTLLPEYRSLVVGQVLEVTYPKLAVVDRHMRITEIRRGTMEEPAVKIEAIEELNRGNGDIVPTDTGPDVPVIIGEDGGDLSEVGTATPRLSILPVALKDGNTDGFLVVADRPAAATTFFNVYYTFDPLLQDYEFLGLKNAFPLHGELVFFKPWDDGKWLLRVKFPNAWDFTDFNEASGLSDFYFTVGHRVFADAGATSEHQTQSMWGRKVVGGRKVAVTADTFDIEVSDEEFATIALALETEAGDGQYPTIHIYFAALDDFFIYPSNVLVFDQNTAGGVGDTGLTRYVKTPVGSSLASQTVNDVDATTFDRDDPTMEADGTLSRDWGRRAFSAYEYFDVVASIPVLGEEDDREELIDDLDTALEAIYRDDATATQESLASDIGAVLGAMIDLPSQSHYNLPGI